MSPSDALAESASWLAVEAATEAADKDGVVAVLKQLTNRPNSAPASILLRLFRAALEAENKDEAVAAFSRLYFEFAGTPESISATNEGRKAGIVGQPPSKATFAAVHAARRAAVRRAPVHGRACGLRGAQGSWHRRPIGR
jgi:hypothetical protein